MATVRKPDGTLLHNVPDAYAQNAVASGKGYSIVAETKADSMRSEVARNMTMGPAGTPYETLVGAGGLLGGIRGGVPGATLGGLAGATGGRAIEAAQGGRPFPKDLAEFVRDVGSEGVMQGALELGGRGLARGASSLAGGLYKGGMRASAAVRRNFPGTPKAALERRIPLTADGAGKAKLLLDESNQKLDALLSEADAAGGKYTADQFVGGVRRLLGDIKRANVNRPEKIEAYQNVRKFLRDYLGEYSAAPAKSTPKTAGFTATLAGKPAKQKPQFFELSPTEVNNLKRRYQELSQEVYRIDKRGVAISPRPKAERKAASRVASSARATLGKDVTKAKGFSEDYIPRNTETQKLMGINQAMKELGERKDMAGPDASLHRPASVPLLGWLRSPEFLGGTALNLTHPAAQTTLRQTPRVADLGLGLGAGMNSSDVLRELLLMLEVPEDTIR